MMKEKNFTKVPTDILVQRMSTLASGRAKKYEPLDTRDFIPFGNLYNELSIENIKSACEKLYFEPSGSCDVLASDRGPSCTSTGQIKGKKVFLVRFLPVYKMSQSTMKKRFQNIESELIQSQGTPTPKPSFASTIYPHSVSIVDLLKAGKLIKPVPTKSAVLHLEEFDLKSQSLLKEGAFEFTIEEEKFASGGFREAFHAYAQIETFSTKHWVLKKYKEQSTTTIENSLGMSIEDHTRKQVQLHIVAKNLAQQYAKELSEEFGERFKYNQIYFSFMNGFPVAIEQYVQGDFTKYVNNDRACSEPNKPEEEIFSKAQCFAHFKYIKSNKKLILLDLQGSKYTLYDPEIATVDLNDCEGEFYFCAGNTTMFGIQKFFEQHVCSKFCKILKMEPNKESGLLSN